MNMEVAILAQSRVSRNITGISTGSLSIIF